MPFLPRNRVYRFGPLAPGTTKPASAGTRSAETGSAPDRLLKLRLLIGVQQSVNSSLGSHAQRAELAKERALLGRQGIDLGNVVARHSILNLRPQTAKLLVERLRTSLLILQNRLNLRLLRIVQAKMAGQHIDLMSGKIVLAASRRGLTRILRRKRADSQDGKRDKPRYVIQWHFSISL
jgi:hypothetical protein